MAKMNAPEMEVVRFANEDVIATSVTLSRFAGGGTGNGTFTFSKEGLVLTTGGNAINLIRDALVAEYGFTTTPGEGQFLFRTTDNSKEYGLTTLYNYNTQSPAKNVNVNAQYYYVGTKYTGTTLRYVFAPRQ